MSNWMHTLKQMMTRRGAQQRSRCHAVHAARRALRLEMLEDRTTPSTFDVIGNILTYTAAAGEANAVTLIDQAATARLTDSGANISLGAGASAAGYTLLDAHTVQGPNGTLTAISMDLGDGNDIANIRAIAHAATVLTGEGNDTINVSSNATIGNLAGIAAGLTVDAGAGINSMTVSDFTASTGNAAVAISATQILGIAGPADASAINYAATGGSFGLLRVLGSNSPTLSESFTVNDPAGAFRLDGNAGADTANVQAISASASINLGAGNDIINVASDAPANLGTLDGIEATLSLDAGTGINTMHVSDFGQTTLANANVSITPAQIMGMAGPTNTSLVNYRASGGTFSALEVDGSDTLADTFHVSGNTRVDLDGNGGDDVFRFATEAAHANSFDGGAGSDLVSYEGFISPVEVTLETSDDTGFSSADATGVGSFAGIDDLQGGSSIDDILRGTDVASNWVVDEESTYSDGAHTLSFADWETLDGGSAVDVFNVNRSAAGVPLTLNGNDGDDVFIATAWDNLQGDMAMNGGAGVNTLAVDDSADTDSVFYNVQATDLQRENAGIINYTDMATITLEAGAGEFNAINVESTPEGSAVTVIGGAGHNDFQVSQVGNNLDALLGDLTLVAGSPTDSLTVNDQFSALAADYVLSDTGITRTDAAAMTLVGAFEQIVVFGGSATNAFDVTPSTTATITVDGGAAATSVLTYVTGGSTTFVDDGFAITDPDASVQAVNYFSIATVTMRT